MNSDGKITYTATRVTCVVVKTGLIFLLPVLFCNLIRSRKRGKVASSLFYNDGNQ